MHISILFSDMNFYLHPKFGSIEKICNIIIHSKKLNKYVLSGSHFQNDILFLKTRLACMKFGITPNITKRERF